jgi:hypothetical protein
MHFLDFPFLVLVSSFVAMWLAAHAGTALSVRQAPLGQEERQYFTIVLSATLTLLGLIIGFAFSMAASHYDLRKHYEEVEANAIGTEYSRADLYPSDENSRIKELLKQYAELRIIFYTESPLNRDGKRRLHEANFRIGELQNHMWSLVESSKAVCGTATTTLVVSGMNEVIDSQGHAQAASWNRVPIEAWVLMGMIAIGCNFLVGFGAFRFRRSLLVILPALIGIAFFFIADIDGPHGGIIRVRPANLMSVAQTLRTH